MSFVIRFDLVATEVEDEKLFIPGGMVPRWVGRVMRHVVTMSRAQAPTGADTGRVKKSRANARYPVGSLKRSISGSYTQTSLRTFNTEISASVPYAAYVHEGTGTAFAKSARIPKGQPGAGQFAPVGFETGTGMYIPANPGWGRAKMVQRRSGQTANPFLLRGKQAAAARHPSIG